MKGNCSKPKLLPKTIYLTTCHFTLLRGDSSITVSLVYRKAYSFSGFVVHPTVIFYKITYKTSGDAWITEFDRDRATMKEINSVRARSHVTTMSLSPSYSLLHSSSAFLSAFTLYGEWETKSMRVGKATEWQQAEMYFNRPSSHQSLPFGWEYSFQQTWSVKMKNILQIKIHLYLIV